MISSEYSNQSIWSYYFSTVY